MVLDCNAWYLVVLHSIGLYCVVFGCTAWYWIVLHCIVFDRVVRIERDGFRQQGNRVGLTSCWCKKLTVVYYTIYIYVHMYICNLHCKMYTYIKRSADQKMMTIGLKPMGDNEPAVDRVVRIQNTKTQKYTNTQILGHYNQWEIMSQWLTGWSVERGMESGYIVLSQECSRNIVLKREKVLIRSLKQN